MCTTAGIADCSLSVSDLNAAVWPMSYLKLFRPTVSGANIWLFQTVSYCGCLDRPECDITKTKRHSAVTVLQSGILSQVTEWTILVVKTLRWNSKLLPSSLQTEKQKTFQRPLTKHVVGRTTTQHAGRRMKRCALQQTQAVHLVAGTACRSIGIIPSYSSASQHCLSN